MRCRRAGRRWNQGDVLECLRLDDSLRCGLVMPGSDRERSLRAARSSEALGFDSIWAGDHLSFHIPILESLTLLSFAAAATERIALGTSVFLLPLRHPTTTAKVAATVDVLSGGRLTLGVGVGGEFPPEFRAVGVPVEERGPRTDETIELLRRLWSEDGVEHRGRHFELGPISLDPKPVQPGGPKIVVGGRKAPSMRRAGQLGDGYISHMCASETYRENLLAIDRHAAAAERGSVDFQSLGFVFTAFDPSYEAALDRAAKMLGSIYRRDFREAAAKYCLLGRPEDCMEQIERFVAAGCRHFVLSPLDDPDEFREQAAQTLLSDIRALSP